MTNPIQESVPLHNESQQDYYNRLHPLLPNFPQEVIISWFYDGNGIPNLFSNLDLRQLTFTEQEWPNDKIPGQEVFQSGFVVEAAKKALDDYEQEPGLHWLADYMLENGTWNTGIIILEDRNENRQLKTYYGQIMHQPFQLLEGHNRLSFLNRLIELNRAAPTHKVWVARLPDSELPDTERAEQVDKKKLKFLSTIELGRFISQRVLVREDCTDHEDRLATLIAVDVVNDVIRIRYENSSIEHKLAPDCIQLVLRRRSAMTEAEKKAEPQPYGHSYDYFEMAIAVDYLDGIGIDSRDYLDDGRAVDAALYPL